MLWVSLRTSWNILGTTLIIKLLNKIPNDATKNHDTKILIKFLKKKSKSNRAFVELKKYINSHKPRNVYT